MVRVEEIQPTLAFGNGSLSAPRLRARYGEQAYAQSKNRHSDPHSRPIHLHGMASASRWPLLGSSSRRLPGKPLDAPEDSAKGGSRSSDFGKLEQEVPRMPDQAPAGLEEPLLQARQRPSLDGDGQNQPTWPRL